ncbi:MAG: leucine-rich repeat domain-containing protein [Clostridia bacterium]
MIKKIILCVATLLIMVTLFACGGGVEFKTLPTDESYYKYKNTTDDFEYVVYNDHVGIENYKGTEKEVSVPSEIEGLPVTEILSEAFAKNQDILKVSLPSCLTKIGNAAFYDCIELEMIDIPKSVYSIGFSAFKNTDFLTANNDEEFFSVGDGILISYNGESTDIKLPSGIKWLTDVFSASNCKSIELNDGLLGISAYAFYECKYLTSINIPNSVGYIGEYAFYNCAELNNIAISKNIYEIDRDAFMNTKWLKSKLKDFIVVGDGVLIYAPDDTAELIIPEGVKVIAEYAFANKYSLEKLTIPEGVEFIDEYAFSGCTKLKEINIPNSVTRFGSGLFESCVALTDINLPESMKFIPRNMFDACTSLIAIELPKDLERIDTEAFLDCSALTNAVIPENTTFLGERAFLGCGSLKSITIYKDVVFIGKSALYTKSELTVNCIQGSYADGFCITNSLHTEYIK